MKKLTVAFLYNIRHRYPDPNDPKTLLEADFDDPETIKSMVKHLKNCGFKVIPIEADKEAYFKLFENKNKIDLAFNYAEGIYGKDREAQFPAILEMLEIPYTGSSPLTQALVLNKAKTKEILKVYGVSVLPHQIFKKNNEKLNSALKFPLIVKPIAQGSSAGITNSSVVYNELGLRKQIKFVLKTFHQEALVEPFLIGREFSVAMLGNPPRILPIIESDHTKLPKKYLPLDSLEVKWFFEDEAEVSNLVCPAKINRKLKGKIEKICLKTWEALEILDLCRIDIRCDKDNNPYVLEVNSPAGLIPPEVSKSSYFPLSSKTAGIEYDSLLKIIIKNGLARYNFDNKKIFFPHW